MLYQAAVILTYPVMLERTLTPSAPRGPAGGLERGRCGVWGGPARRWHRWSRSGRSAWPVLALVAAEAFGMDPSARGTGWAELEARAGEGCSRLHLRVCQGAGTLCTFPLPRNITQALSRNAPKRCRGGKVNLGFAFEQQNG